MIGTSGQSAARFLIGTCGYSYPGVPPNGWSGVFYPKRRAKRVDELEYYAAHFNSVEINSTFYRPPSAEMAKGWAERTPPGFVFAVKVWQKFTHPTQLGGDAMMTKEPWERFDSQDVERFSAGIQPLADSARCSFNIRQASFATQRLLSDLQWFSRRSRSIPKRLSCAITVGATNRNDFTRFLPVTAQPGHLSMSLNSPRP